MRQKQKQKQRQATRFQSQRRPIWRQNRVRDALLSSYGRREARWSEVSLEKRRASRPHRRAPPTAPPTTRAPPAPSRLAAVRPPAARERRSDSQRTRRLARSLPSICRRNQQQTLSLLLFESHRSKRRTRPLSVAQAERVRGARAHRTYSARCIRIFPTPSART